WNAVHARIARRSREIGDAVKRGLSKQGALSAGRGRTPKYLLSTLLVCDMCGSRLVIAGAKGASYACSSWLNGGEGSAPAFPEAPFLERMEQWEQRRQDIRLRSGSGRYGSSRKRFRSILRGGQRCSRSRQRSAARPRR